MGEYLLLYFLMSMIVSNIEIQKLNK